MGQGNNKNLTQLSFTGVMEYWSNETDKKMQGTDF
jgi:hypothetical protein